MTRNNERIFEIENPNACRPVYEFELLPESVREEVCKRAEAFARPSLGTEFVRLSEKKSFRRHQ
jgi:hypothetical protein